MFYKFILDKKKYMLINLVSYSLYTWQPKLNSYLRSKSKYIFKVESNITQAAKLVDHNQGKIPRLYIQLE